MTCSWLTTFNCFVYRDRLLLLNKQKSKNSTLSHSSESGGLYFTSLNVYVALRDTCASYVYNNMYICLIYADK